MRDLFLRFCRWALPLLGISGVISCDNVIQSPDMYGCSPAPEYGVPVMEFRMKGKVVDSQSEQPINGEFICQGEDETSESMILKFTDVDGQENLGEFMEKEVKVKLTREEGSENGWFTGIYISDDVLVKLDTEPEVTPEYGLPYSEYSAKENAK